MFFAATREEMTRAGETFEANNTTEIVGGDGDRYLAALGVYHELHCLVKYQQCHDRQSSRSHGDSAKYAPACSDPSLRPSRADEIVHRALK